MRISRSGLAALTAPIVLLVLGHFSAVTGQAPVGEREREIAESEIRQIAAKAKTEGKRSVVYDNPSQPAVPVSPQNRIGNATVLVVTAAAPTKTLFYQPPPFFWTLRMLRVDEELATSRLAASCRHSVDQPLPGHVWAAIEGGERMVDGVMIRHNSHWPVVPVAGRRYLVLGQRCAGGILELPYAAQDIYELMPDGRIVFNPWPSDFVRYVNNLRSLTKVKEVLNSLH